MIEMLHAAEADPELLTTTTVESTRWVQGEPRWRASASLKAARTLFHHYQVDENDVVIEANLTCRPPITIRR